jgi:hypothetical protein
MLEVVRHAYLNTRGNIFYKPEQILAYAKNKDTIGRSQAALREAFTKLKKAAREINLKIDKE